MIGVNKLPNGSEVLLVDFSNCTTDQMVCTMKESRDWVLHQMKPVNVLVVFGHGNFITAKFFEALLSYKTEGLSFIAKSAIVGMSKVQKAIFEKYRSLHKRNFEVFNHIEDAIRYLSGDEHKN